MINKKGFTLIEVVLSLALIGIVITLIISPIIFSYNNFETQYEKSHIISTARTAMDYLTREIRKASTVDVDNNTIIIDSHVYKLEDRVLLKEDQKVVEGIDGLIVTKNNSTVNIEITIKYSNEKEYKLSSQINIR